MKRHSWKIINTITNEWVIYNSNIGLVNKHHVATSPSVKEWLNGSPHRIISND